VTGFSELAPTTTITTGQLHKPPPLATVVPTGEDGPLLMIQAQDNMDSESSPPGFSRSTKLFEADAKLQAFTSTVRCRICLPLAPRPAKTKRVARPTTPEYQTLPKRSEQLAKNPLATVKSSRRAEVVNPASNDRMVLYYCLMTKVDWSMR
jgi:hypothetical protein